jgi:hypothetical protein
MTAIYNPDSDVFMSPMADGPIQFNDALTDNPKLVNITRFGRSFSVVQIPYSLKLLIQELQTMNCVMRVITEDNIDQIESMSFSDNYKILSGQKGEDADIESMEGGRSQGERQGQTVDNDFRLVISDPMRDNIDAMRQSQQQSGNNDNDDETIEEIVIQEGNDASPDVQQMFIASQSKQGANANANINLESGEKEKDSLGKEWTKLVDQESGKEYYYNEKTKDTMWYPPQPSKDYELRPPFGWYAVDIAGHIYLYNPQKNLIKMPEDVTFADANERPEEETAEKKEETKSENLPSILMIEKTGENDGNESGSSGSNGSGDKKIII